MAQLDTTKKTLEISEDDPSALSASSSSSSDQTQADAGNTASDLSISRSGSFSRLNASAPEFVPRAPSPGPPAPTGGHPRIVKIHHHPSPPPPVIHVFHPPPPPSPSVSPQFIPPGPPIGVYDYYGGTIGGGGGGGGGGFGDHDSAQHPADSDSTLAPRDCLPEDVVQKITKQVEYYFSDLNLATTEHLMRFISKDPEGFVPISVVASFKKIKALVHNNLMLANALRTSSKLVVSDDGKRVRRVQPFTEADVEELQSRIVVAENLPEDHAYQNLMKIFSTAGSVKTIRTCYPQTSNGTAAPTNRSSKLDMLFCNKLHAFVEYETVEDAERAVAEVSKERNWRSGLRLRLLNKCMAKQVSSRGRKPGNDGDGDEDEAHATNNYLGGDKQAPEDSSQQADSSLDPVEEGSLAAAEREGGGRRGGGKARGRGRGRGARGQYHNNNSSNNSNLHRGHAPIGTPPSLSAHPPGPRMPDGTRGFATGRGKPIVVPPPSAVATG